MNSTNAAGEFGWLRHPAARERLAGLESALDEALRCEDPWLADVTSRLIRRGGKRLRPALLFVAAGLGPSRDTGDERELLLAAAAVELLHVAALYHDDVMDRARTRRDALTANALWGEAAAVTAGTFIFARAMKLLARMDEELARWASQSAVALALGQLQEAENTFNLDHRLDSYTRIAARKTASLFELPCRIGAYLGGAGQAVIDAAGLYGRAVGMAFQIVDDTLDLTAEAASFGKHPGTDLREGVYGLPVLLALERGPRSREIRGVLERQDLTEAEIREACREIVSTGAVAAALHAANEYSAQAVEHLKMVPDGPARESLILLANYIVVRRY
ncbi:polyprenyl synthetase family protein [Actinomadura sp. KC06]|uniref:polyprenyl synthetase family protein n=1 Tax=Actinomadura sp. KC06 TaxID=2530369 RepID=UPI0010482F5B|nr:polyprenyl synthetase family protein [Actinomadura sp. KC06]TDD34667.1 polyprenyl synthetase family protein [Actinomadura sp. KC06]